MWSRIALFELERYEKSVQVLRKAERLRKLNASMHARRDGNTEAGDAHDTAVDGLGAGMGSCGLSRWVNRAELEVRAQKGETEPFVVDGDDGAAGADAGVMEAKTDANEPPVTQPNVREVDPSVLQPSASASAAEKSTTTMKKEEDEKISCGGGGGDNTSTQAKEDAEEVTVPRVSWTQKADRVTISVHMKGIDVENVSFAFLDMEARLVVRERKDKGGAILYKREWKLANAVKKTECRCLVMDTKITLRLVKADAALVWPELESAAAIAAAAAAAETKSANARPNAPPSPTAGDGKTASASASASTSVAPSGVRGPPASRVFPSSAKTSRNWDKIEQDLKEEEENEKLSGDAALNKLFQDIYSKADDDTRRAMQKSFVESNGTVLSTNWGEIGAKKVDVQAPGGMEVRQYEQ